jgi:glutamyl-tRNA synthetase
LESSLQVLKGAYPILEKLQIWDNTSLFIALKTFSEKNALKVGTVMWPIRTAISGLLKTPGGATELAEIIGKPETLRRIKLGIAKLEIG